MSNHYYFWTEDRYIEVDGSKLSLFNIECLVIKNPNPQAMDYEKWLCIELFTGLVVSRGDTRERAMKNAMYLTHRYGELYALEHILSGIAEFGGSPYIEKHQKDLFLLKKRLEELKPKEKVEEKQKPIKPTIDKEPITLTATWTLTKEDVKPKRGRPSKQVVANRNAIENLIAEEIIKDLPKVIEQRNLFEEPKKRGRKKKDGMVTTSKD
jgi:hypothetical protein